MREQIKEFFNIVGNRWYVAWDGLYNNRLIFSNAYPCVIKDGEDYILILSNFHERIILNSEESDYIRPFFKVNYENSLKELENTIKYLKAFKI